MNKKNKIILLAINNSQVSLTSIISICKNTADRESKMLLICPAKNNKISSDEKLLKLCRQIENSYHITCNYVKISEKDFLEDVFKFSREVKANLFIIDNFPFSNN